jgi:hypothetical protein
VTVFDLLPSNADVKAIPLDAELVSSSLHLLSVPFKVCLSLEFRSVNEQTGTKWGRISRSAWRMEVG